MEKSADIFRDAFFGWWRNQTTVPTMTAEIAIRLVADCRFYLEPKLVPDRMTQDEFKKQLETAHKVIRFGVRWEEARTANASERRKQRKIPKM